MPKESHNLSPKTQRVPSLNKRYHWNNWKKAFKKIAEENAPLVADKQQQKWHQKLQQITTTKGGYNTTKDGNNHSITRIRATVFCQMYDGSSC